MGEALPGFLALPGIALLALVATAAGRRLVGRLLPDADEGERTLLGFPAGMAALSVAAAALLFSGVPPRWPLLGLLAVAGLWSRRDAAALLSGVRSGLSGWGETGRAERAFRALALFFAVLGLAGCLAPETGWDTGLYHFAVARLRAEEGWMVARLDISPSYRPGYMETLYTVGFLFQGETLASLFNFAFYFAGLAFVRFWARRAAGERAGLLAGFAWLTSTTLVLRTNGGDVELGQALFLTAALYALQRLREGASVRWAGVAGAALGMMLGIKYASAWACLAAGAAWLVVRIRDRAGLRRMAGEGAAVVCLGALFGLPWYLRNVIAVGNPTFPFVAATPAPPGGPGFGWVTGLARGFGLDAFVIAAGAGLVAPAAARLRWLAAVPLLWLALLVRQLGFAPEMAVAAARYISPAFPVLFVLAAAGIDHALVKRPWPGRAGLAFLGLALAPALGVHGLRNIPKIPAAAGLESREAYLERRIDSYWAIRRAVREVPPGKKVLLVEQRVYYCRAPFLAAADVQQAVRFDEFASPEEFRGFLERNGIAFVVYSHSAVAKTWGFRNLLARFASRQAEAGLELVEARADCTLYRVR